VLLAGALVVAPSFATDPWDVNENFLSFAVADAHWTIDEVFPGTKLIVEGQYSIRRGPGEPPERDCDCDLATTPDRMVGTIAAHLQWGEGGICASVVHGAGHADGIRPRCQRVTTDS